VQNMLGGIVNYRWRCGRVEILFRRRVEGVEGCRVYRVPERLVGEMFRGVKIERVDLKELDM